MEIEEEDRQRRFALEQQKLEIEKEAVSRCKTRELKRVERESDVELERVSVVYLSRETRPVRLNE